MSKLGPLVIALNIFAVWLPWALGGPAPSHPLDALTAREIWKVQSVLQASGHLDGESRFVAVRLHQPPKALVLSWQPGTPFERRALAVVKKGPRAFEAIVDLNSSRLQSWREAAGMAPAWTLEELEGVGAIIIPNAEWQAAMRKRGINDFESVFPLPDSAGYFGLADEEGKRLLRVSFFDMRGVTNFLGRPIGGVTAVVDMVRKEVVKIIDTGVVPIPDDPVEFDEASIGTLRDVPSPISMSQPRGPGFRITGNQVSWQNWSFHFQIDPRLGPVISTVRYRDGSKTRSILYQASLSELFVPYMDPGVDLYHRAYFDVGEFGNGFGGLTNTLEPGLDCPENAVFFDAVHADDSGKPQVIHRAVALFERYDGSMAWRHGRWVTGRTESRARRDLVLRSIATLGNYDYIFDWVFQQNGAIKVAVGATGIDMVKGVAARTTLDDNAGAAGRYGRLVAPHTLAINHDHFFSFRLDLDVDGQDNSFERDRLETIRTDGKTPRRSVWVVDAQVAKTEGDARLNINLEKPSLWRVINPGVRSPMGYPVSYQIMPGANARSLLAADDHLQKRAGFTDYHLWVTPYRAEEMFAAGPYPNLSKGGDGLPAWTAANRSIENTDIVVWYTLGFHHVVRAEDWPTMPTKWHEFELRPFDFFGRNPALDLPERPVPSSTTNH